MITDEQIRKCSTLRSRGKSQAATAAISRMHVQTARKYERLGRLPGATRGTRSWRTRADPFEEVGEQVCEQLELSPGLEGATLLQWFHREYGARFGEGQVRTFQRRIKQWRATAGSAKEVFFAREHTPGRLGQSDFTHMSKLGVTIAGEAFEHLVHHFVLTYSNGEWCSVCFSESLESLSDGLQGALWDPD